MKTFAAIGLLLTVALVAAVAVVSDRSDDAGASSGQVDAMRLSEHIRVVSGDDFEGRAPASGAGEQKTIDYVVAQLTAARVEPGGEADASGRRTWTQDVPLAQADISGPVTASFRVGGSQVALQQG